MSVAVVLGSAFEALPIALEPVDVPTRAGPFRLYRAERGWVCFRHGRPHRWLPNQIPYRALALALAEVGVRSLLVTSSVGVLDPSVPLFTPLLVEDLVWLDNRLPDGTAATVWEQPDPEQGHLVVEHGLFSHALGDQLRALSSELGQPLPEREVVFWYAPGPRTKTKAENRMLRQLGLQVNSMTLAPEVVLANELGIATAAVVVGHKASQQDSGPLGRAAIAESLVSSREAVQALALAWLERGEPVENPNPVYRFGR